VNRAPSQPKTSLTILLVEDDRDHAELIRRALRDHQAASEIHHVGDGEAALDYLFRRARYANPLDSPTPHMVLLDLRLPRIGGLEVLAKIRRSRRLKKTPVVVLTTSRAESDVARAYELHASSYVVKPDDSKSFNKLMTDLGAYWFAWNQYPS
jgi:CheY-like chemotaxis protein